METPASIKINIEQNNTESTKKTLSTEELLKLYKFPVKNNPFSKEENLEFLSVYSELEEVLTNVEPWSRNSKYKETLKEILYYILYHGTKTRGLATVLAYKHIEESENLTSENIKLAIVLGWCIVMVEETGNIIDDIADNAEYRCGKLCWHRNQHVGGKKATVDSICLHNGIYHVLKTYFSKHPQYVKLVELYLDVNFRIYLSQCLDMSLHNLDDYTNDTYQMLSLGKSQQSVFYHPVAAAMLLANISDEELHRQSKSLALYMGHFFQMQTDYLDCYGGPEELGRIGTDIIEGKCTWPVWKALEKSTPSQKKLIHEHYGKKEDKSVRIILNIYDDLNLKEEYVRCEEEIYSGIHSRISQLPEKLPKELFYYFLDKMRLKKWYP
ncbi:hypothetical protein JTB14_001653 [Gonioctena quinquepunctata]|nr:hypothetical protein JTB14_001653 [Gonioctena quinquepunctata]